MDKMKKDWSINELQEVWLLAGKMHDGQKYGGVDSGEQVEYLNHIGNVVFEILATINKEEKMNSDLAIKCAILHDTIEDTELNYNEIKKQYGEVVAEGVMALTKNEEIEGKKAKMLDSLKRIKNQPKEIWMVKMADRISNLYAPPFYWDNDKKEEYIKEALVIHEELSEGSSYLATRLLEKIENYKKYID